MKKKILIPVISSALAAWSSVAEARLVVILPGVVGPTGVTSGVDTTGTGTLTVGNQDINTGNDPGGAITTDAANTANIVFTGTSTVTGFVGKTGTTFLNIAAGTNGNTVIFNGPVFATTFSVSGTGTDIFNGGFTSNTGSTMDFAGDGVVNVGAGQTVKAAITNSAGAKTGTLILNGNSILNGAVGAASGLKQINVVGGNALITGQVNAATYSLGTNTLNVGGAFSTPVAGIINTTIFSPSSYGKIIPVGAATIGNALQVNITVTGPIANGTSFNIVDATSGTSGSTVIATTNTTRYAFIAGPTTNGQVKVTTTQIPLAVVVTPVVNPVVPGTTPVAPVVIAPVIDALPVTATTSPLITAITLLPTAPAVANALAQLGPGTASFNSPQVSYRTTQQMQDLWESDFENAPGSCDQSGQPNDRNRRRLEDASACQPSDMRSRWWGMAFGNFGKQDSIKGFDGYESQTVGAMLAYDTSLNETTRAGIGIRYARSTLQGNNLNTDGSINSYQATAYLGYAPGPWFANAALIYGLDYYSGSRHVLFPGIDSTAAADYSGHQYSAFGTTGYHFYADDGRTTITPYATLQYTHLHTSAYTETGGGAIDLAVNSQSYEFLQSGLGGKVAYVIPMSGRQIIRPEIHISWLHSFGGETMKDTATFASGSAAFTTVGLKPNRDTYNVGAGIVFANNGAWSVEGAYDYQWRRDSYAAQQVMIKIVMPL